MNPKYLRPHKHRQAHGLRHVFLFLIAFTALCGMSANSSALSIWSNTVTPTSVSFDTNDVSPYEFGVKFKSTVSGTVTGVRFYKGPFNTGTHVANLWTAGGTLLARTNFTSETSNGWQQASFAAPVPIAANTIYVASYFAPVGGYSADLANELGSLSAGVTNLPLIAVPNSESGNGVLAASPTTTFPSSSANGINWWVDVVFVPSADTNPPTVSAVSPTAGAINVSPNAPVTVTFNEAMLASTISTNTITLVNALSNPVPATVSYNAGSATATLQPLSPLTLGETYTARVKSGASGVKDASTNALVADFVWSFTVTSQSTVSIWDPTTTPGVAVDNGSYTLGVKFRSTAAGFIRGIRFYKGVDNTGTHIGNLWTLDGTKLGEATFAGESASGWQEQLFATPVAISSNTTYVASYFAPAGNYAFTAAYFATQGVTNPPLIALPEGADGGNGVFIPTPTNTFPNTSFNSANYWVDVVYVPSLGPDTNAPTVVSTTPASNATNASLTTTVSATFNEPMLAASINTNSFELRTAGNALVPATVTYNAGAQTAVLQPLSSLGLGQTYTARVKGGTNGVKDTSTNALAADYVWNFTTSGQIAASIWSDSATPQDPSTTDTFPYELGVKFRSAIAGYILGVRFYKGTNNTGTHLGNLWTANGTNLASLTFTNETTSGWQQQLFASPVPIASNTTYVVSYFAPNGGYALDSGYFATSGVTNYPLRALADGEQGGNGVYTQDSVSSFPTASFGSANYWVDVVFTDQNTPPTAGTLNVSLPEDTSTNLVLLGSDAEGPVTFQLLSGPSHGTLSNFNSTSGTVTYAPITNYFGPDAFTYRVSDGSLFATGTVNLTVTAVNDPAIANNQNISLPKDTGTNLVLTASDADGANTSFNVLAASSEITHSNWVLVAGASKVAAVATDDGNTSYIRSTSTSGTLQQFTLTDPIHIQPGDPINSVAIRSTCKRNSTPSGDFQVTAILGGSTAAASTHGTGNSYVDYTDTFPSRPGGGAWTLADVENLQVRIQNTQGRDITCTKLDAVVSFQGFTDRAYTILSGPSHGSISGLNTNNGTLNYNPAPGYVGPDSFTFRVSSAGQFSTGLVSMTIVGTNNGPVVANPISNQAATYGTTFNFTFPTNTFTDPDSPTLTYSATGMPPGILFTNATRTFGGSPSASGNYPVALVAADNSVPPLKATNVFSINVAKAPLSVTASNQSKPYGVPFSFAGNEFFTVGLKFSDTATNATLNSAGSSAGAAAGPYPITVTNALGLGLSNYNISYSTGTLTVTPPAPFSITAIGVTNNVATITWQSISGRVYRLEYKDLLTAPAWTEVPVDIISTGNSTTTTNNTGGATNRFYRVK